MEKNNTHLAGEYFVAAELYRRGFSVGMTIGNAKTIDMLASKDESIVAVQVKAIRNKKSVSWPIRREQVKKGVIYVFVNLNDQDVPDYYVATSNEIVGKIKEYGRRGILELSTLKSCQYKDRWDKLSVHEKPLNILSGKKVKSHL